MFSIFLVLNFEIKKDNIKGPYIALENDLSKETPLIGVSAKQIEKTHRRKQNIEEGKNSHWPLRYFVYTIYILLELYNQILRLVIIN